MAFRTWPAPITGWETVQLVAGFAIMVTALVNAFTKAQLLTPVSNAWLILCAGVGAMIGWRLGRLIVRVNRDSMDRFRGYLLSGILTFLGGFIFIGMGKSVTARHSFAHGGIGSFRSFPIVRVTHDKHDYNHWAIINPFGLWRGGMVPLSDPDYSILMGECGRECAGRYCIEVPVETSPDGSVRMMMGESEQNPPNRRLTDCYGNSLVPKVTDPSTLDRASSPPSSDSHRPPEPAPDRPGPRSRSPSPASGRGSSSP